MRDWTKVSKLERMAPIEAGSSRVARFIARGSGVGVATGFSEIDPGWMDVEIGDPELFIVLEGVLQIEAGGQLSRVEANEAVWLPAGEAIRLGSPDGCRLLYTIIESPT